MKLTLRAGTVRPIFPGRRALILSRSSLSLLVCGLSTSLVSAQDVKPTTEAADDSPRRQIGVIVVTGERAGQLPTRLPTTVEGISGARIAESINASDSPDALKYLPSLLVRKRYVGDYNHAVLSTRASGTGNSARSLVYADGVQLSNLLGNGAAFAPRWGLVTTEEIARVDVLYGPFSAAFPGNAVGAVVDFVTRTPTRFEAHARLSGFTQPNEMYGQSNRFGGGQASASLGSRDGALAWWFDATRTSSHGQPMVFSNKLLSAGTTLRGGESTVSGGVADVSPRLQPWTLIGSATEYAAQQEQAKLKLTWDITPTLRWSGLLAGWSNRSDGQSRSWLRDATGQAVDNRSGGDITQAIAIDGRRYTLTSADFPRTRDESEHLMSAATLKSRSSGDLDWELAASQVDYRKDTARAYAPTSRALPLGGRITDMAGTGWNTLHAKLTWRPAGAAQDSQSAGSHVVNAGLQQDSARLRNRVDTTTDFLTGGAQAFASRFEGRTRLRSAYVQDTWVLARDWISVLGLRAENWQAWDGLTQSAYAGASDVAQCLASQQRCTLAHPARSQTALSPKAALSQQWNEDWVFKASTGRALRFPTVSELYQGGINALGQAINNNRDLRPEVSWTSELSAEWTRAGLNWRSTLFHEATRDALYAQLNPATNANTVQNIRRVRTTGLEMAVSATDLGIRGLELQGSLTYADSRIIANDGYVLIPGDTLGKRQPRVPSWRAGAMATWRANDALSLSLGMRYSGRQFSTLDNGDPNGNAYTGASPYTTADLRLRWKIDHQWSLALGIDNLNNARYWNFHPYPQRTTSVELRWDL